MKRGPIAVVAAIAGLASALGLHTSGSSTPLVSGSNSPASPTTTSPPPKGTKHPQPPVSTSPGGVPAGKRSMTGTTYQYGYGQLAVRVTAGPTRITGLSVVGLQTAESYSQQLANQVIPMLRNEVLSAQSARVNGISGATYTSEAYLYSVQSALDKMHIK